MPDSTATLDLVVAEETARTAMLQPAVAATYMATATASLSVAEPYSLPVGLDLLLDGSYYLMPLLRVVVAETHSLAADLNQAVAEPYELACTLDAVVSDAPAMLLEPDDPQPAGVSVPDLMLSLHPNVLRSPTTDFSTFAEVGGVVELLEGPNRGNYLIFGIDGNALFVTEAFRVPTAVGPYAGSVRGKTEVSATPKAAIMLDQSIFLAPFSVSALLDVVID